MLGVPVLRKAPPYDPVVDFTPITSFIRFTVVLVCHPSVPANTLGELVEYGRANPGRLNYGSGSISAKLAGVQLASFGKLSIVHVPYKGEAAAMPDLLSGRVQLMFASGTVAAPLVKEGKLRALAMLLPQRSPLLPEVPTVAEAGMPQLSIVVWTGLFGPSRMPADLVDRLAGEVRAVLARPDVREQLLKQSLDPVSSSPAELASYLKEQLVDWGKAAREAGMTPE
jgi:tripartite-type tricarboxylate transporter receptor subunit TctC